MMYLTAHRVFSRSRQRDAMNAFRYEHHGERIPGMSWDRPDLTLIARSHPGVLVVDDVEIAPGGNEVMSYLDLAAHDGVADERLKAVLERFVDGMAGQNPAELVADGVAVRSWVSEGLQGCEKDELSELSTRLGSLIGRQGRTWNSGAPIDIVVQLEPDGFTCSIAPGSVARVDKARGFPVPNERVTVSRDVEAGIRDAVEHLTLELAVFLTRLSTEQLLALGGVRFIAEDGRALGEWPVRGVDNAGVGTP